MITLDDLQAFAERGWRMFPIFKVRDGVCVCRAGADCNAPGKHPHTHNGVKAATDDPKQIIAWHNRYPGCNWAVATGEPSSVWVLDIDKHGTDGAESMRGWLEANSVVLHETFTVATGGGGWHLYFRMPIVSLPNRTNVMPGVDVRSTGGYVLLPGSNHASGSDYAAIRDVPVAHAPSRLVEYVASHGSSGRQSGGVRGRREERSSLRRVDHYLIHGFTPGNRDVECYDLSCSLWRKHWDDPLLVEAIIGDCWRATDQSESRFPWSQAKYKMTRARAFVQQQMEAEATFLRNFGGAV